MYINKPLERKNNNNKKNIQFQDIMRSSKQCV